MPRARARLVAGTAALLALPLCAQATGPLGGATPEALVERMRGAAAKRDLVEASRCLTPEARTDMTAGMFVGAMVLVEFAKEAPELEDQRMAAAIGEDGSMDAEALREAAKRRAAAEAEAIEIAQGFDALLERHGLALPDSAGGLDREEMTRRFLAIDQPAFLADLMELMESASDEPDEATAAKTAIDLGELSDLVVDGDRATATVGGRPVGMERLDGRWFFTSTDVMRPAAAADAG